LLVLGWSAEDAGAVGEEYGSEVEVAECGEVVEGDVEVDIDLFEPVDVMADFDLVDGKAVGGVPVGRGALFTVLGSFKVFVEAALLSLSSPQTPVSQGSEEQQPE
jgi:hypothetical protein